MCIKLKSDLIQYCQDSESVTGILNLFPEDFLAEFDLVLKKQRPAILKAMPYLYRMWYYSALVENTSLSPANFISSQISAKYEKDEIVVPIARPNFEKKSLKGFDFDFIIFNMDNHPVLEDLQLFLEACSPDIGVDKDGLLLDEEREKFINSLNFKEIFYITFLTNLSYEMRFLRKMPSIGIYRSTPVSDNINNFLKLPQKEQLKKIVDAIFSIASKNLCQVFTFDRKTFSKESLYNLFRNSADMTEFTENIYKKFNLNTDDLDTDYLEGLDFESLDDLEDLDISPESLMALNLRIDIEFLLDAYLLTPLGYYLQLIQPIYINEMDFFRHFEELLEADRINLPPIKLFFRMADGFDITPLGEKLLLEGNTPKNLFQTLRSDVNYDDLYSEIISYNSEDDWEDFDEDESAFEGDAEDISDLMESVSDDFKRSKKAPSTAKSESKEIINDKNKAYSFKIKHIYNKRSWQTIELKGTQTMEDLSSTIIRAFDLDPGHMYSFFMNNKAYDRSFEIACPYATNTKNITTKQKIHDLKLYKKQKFLFIYDFGDDIRFEVEFIEAADLDKDIRYPIVKNTSKDYRS